MIKLQAAVRKLQRMLLTFPEVLLVASRAAIATRVTVVEVVHNQMDGKYCNTNVKEISFVQG